MAIGAQHDSVVGMGISAKQIGLASPTTYAAGPINSGWAARFTARDSRDISGFSVYYSTITAAGVILGGIQTVDATTGKPSGTLYDASASKSFVPASGHNPTTFDTLPTAGLVAGTEYYLVLLTTTGGTTHTMRSHQQNAHSSSFPTALFTAADGTVASNYAIVSASCPLASLIFEDGAEQALGFAAFPTLQTYDIFGTTAFAAKITVPAGVVYVVDGVNWCGSISGTPAGDLRLRILASAGVAVSGATRTIDKDSLIGAMVGRYAQVQFFTPVTLYPGTYYVTFDSAACADSSNCYTIRGAQARVAELVPSGCNVSTTSDVTADPIVWTDVDTECACVHLSLSSLSGGAAQLINYGLVG